MSLIKRQKKRKSSPQLPGRQVICRNCGARLFVDECPGGNIPPYCCLECRSSWPPSAEEQQSQAHRQAEYSLKMQQRTKEARDRLERGLPIIWVPEIKLTPKQKRKTKIQARMDEILAKPANALSKSEWRWLHEVWAFLTGGTGRGRRKAPKYEECSRKKHEPSY